MGNTLKRSVVGIPRCDGRTACFFLLLLVITLHLSLTSVLAQDDDFVPPPLQSISKDERAKLSAITDVKNRTKLSLELMATRLTAAEQYNTNVDFEGVFRELGGFQALLDNSLDFLGHQNSQNGKVLDSYKRLEIELRAFLPRVEGIRRDVPLRYENYVRRLVNYVRDARSRAVDPLFSDKVVQVKNS